MENERYVWVVSYGIYDDEEYEWRVLPCLVGMFSSEEKAKTVVRDLKLKCLDDNDKLRNLIDGISITKVKLDEQKAMLTHPVNKGTIYTDYAFESISNWNEFEEWKEHENMDEHE